MVLDGTFSANFLLILPQTVRCPFLMSRASSQIISNFIFPSFSSLNRLRMSNFFLLLLTASLKNSHILGFSVSFKNFFKRSYLRGLFLYFLGLRTTGGGIYGSALAILRIILEKHIQKKSLKSESTSRFSIARFSLANFLMALYENHNSRFLKSGM